VEFTKALAKRGYPVLAVARGVEPLARMANELKRTAHSSRRRPRTSRARKASGPSSRGRRPLGDVESSLQQRGTLPRSGDFLEQSVDKEIQSIRVNVEAL